MAGSGPGAASPSPDFPMRGASYREREGERERRGKNEERLETGVMEPRLATWLG